MSVCSRNVEFLKCRQLRLELMLQRISNKSRGRQSDSICSKTSRAYSRSRSVTVNTRELMILTARLRCVGQKYTVFKKVTPKIKSL